MSDPVRLTLIGCGRIAQVAHLPAMEKAEGIELVSVSDLSAEVARSVFPGWHRILKRTTIIARSPGLWVTIGGLATDDLRRHRGRP